MRSIRNIHGTIEVLRKRCGARTVTVPEPYHC